LKRPEEKSRNKRAREREREREKLRGVRRKIHIEKGERGNRGRETNEKGGKEKGTKAGGRLLLPRWLE